MGDTMPILEQAVYVRRVRSGDAPRDGQTDGFSAAAGLRCLGVRMRSGTEAGYATFDLVSLDGSELATEDVFGAYRPGDQVRVVIPPYDSVVGAGRDLVIFHGVIEGSAAVAGTGGEGLQYVARALPYLDNQGVEHVVTGRWMADADGGLMDIEAADLPAVFNFRGKPNRHADATFAVAGGGSAALWTHDEDAEGAHWTVGQAMASHLGRWLMGEVSAALPRTVSVAGVDLSGGGFDAVCPEVSVHGLGALDGLQALCDAAGFEMNLQVDLDDAGDRPYLLQIQRRGEGAFVTVGLPPRGRFPSSARAVLRQSHIDTFRLGASAAPVRTQAEVIGPARIECTVELRPLWDPADFTADPASADYAVRHVVGGAEFAEHAAVGRRWGVADVGSEPGYDDGDYAHDRDGYDWVAELGIGGALAAARTAAGVTEPIAWARRPRRALPLTSREARALASRYVLEVSEDGGGSWAVLSGARFRTLADGFGVELDVTDLAATDLAALAGETAADGGWWGLIDSQDLRMRLTCEVACDHAARARAERQGGAGSLYPLLALGRDRGGQVWAQPDSFANPGGEWVLRSTAQGDASATRLIDSAERARDGAEALSFRGQLGTWVMAFQRWRLGDRVRRIEGRNQALGLATAGGFRFPTIGSIDIVLANAGEDAAAQQRISVGLYDARANGRAG